MDKMREETLNSIDQCIETLCAEMKGVRTDQVIALAEALGKILAARVMITDN